MSTPTRSIFRVDKFVVPAESKDTFLTKLKETHRLLDSAEGCVQNRVLEQVSGPGRFNIVTLVEWRDEAAYEEARTAAQARHEAAGFDPGAMFEAFRISPDIANYADVLHD